MKAYEIQEFGIDRLAINERDTPTPADGEVLVKIHASETSKTIVHCTVDKLIFGLDSNKQLPKVKFVGMNPAVLIWSHVYRRIVSIFSWRICVARRFSRATRADDSEDGAARHFEGHMVDGDRIVVATSEALHRHDRVSRIEHGPASLARSVPKVARTTLRE